MDKPLLRVLFLLAITFGLAGGEAYSYSFRTSKLESPIVVRDGEVFFAQPDGFLTVLSARDGTVLRRLKLANRLSLDAFDIVDGDILGIGRYEYQSGILLLDGKTGRIRWSAAGDSVLRHRNMAIGSDRKRLFALDFATGRQLWEWHAGVEVLYDAIDDELYVMRETRDREAGGFLVCLDIVTGRQKWRQDAPPGENWVKMGLFDDAVRILAGGAEQNADLDRVVCFSRDGTPLPRETPAACNAERKTQVVWQKTMRTDGKVYRSGVIRQVRYYPSTYLPGRKESGKAGLEFSDWHEGMPLDDCAMFSVSGLLLGGDRSSWGFFSGYPNEGYGFRDEGKILDRRFHFLDEDSAWSGTPGYLNRHRSTFLNQIALTGEVLIVATGDGQMECLDRKTGASRWIYVYPSRWRDISYSDEWRPFITHVGSYLSSLRAYEREKLHGEVMGTVVTGEPAPGRFRVVVDPEPAGYYESPRVAMLLILLTPAAVPVTMAGLVVPLAKRGKPGLGIALLLGVMVCSYPFGFMMGVFSHSFALAFDMFEFSLLCLAIYWGLSAGDGGKAPPRSRLIGLMGILFLPFTFWTVYCAADTITQWFS